MGMTALTPTQIAMQWIQNYNSHNPEQAASLYHEQVTNLQLPWGNAVIGRDAMKHTYEKVFRAFPDITIEARNIIAEASTVVIEWRFTGTMKGEFAGFAPNHHSFDMNGCEVFEIVDGLIFRQHGYWDKATMFSQLQL